MRDPILPLLVGILAALLALGGVAGVVARGSRQAVGFAGAGLGGIGFLLTLLVLLLGPEPATLVLPLGLPNLPLRLALDPLAAFFLCPIFLTGTAAIAFAAESGGAEPASGLTGLATCLAGVTLAALAADGVSVALGLALAGGAIWASGEPGRPRTVQLGMTGLAALAILGAAALRDDPALAPAVLGLALIGPGALAGLAPFHRWPGPVHRAAPSQAALLSGALQPLALYLLLRLLLDLGGIAPPLWWGVPPLLMGSATALTGGWRAATSAEVDSCLAGLTERQAGLAAIGIGLALIGRATDLPGLTTLAAASVLLLLVSQTVCGTLAHLVAGAIRTGAGSRRLVSLGGLVQSMPLASAGMGAALYGFAALPAGAGFAAFWLQFQALLAAPRTPALVLVAAVLALSAVLSGAALVRLVGVAFLGRPRGPRSAAATDIARPAGPPILALAGIALLIGAFPGVVLLLGGGALQRLDGVGLDDRAGILGLSGYPVLPLLLLALAMGGAVLWLRRRLAPSTPRFSPAWNDGLAPPPAWLPFGDPLTQTAGEGFLPPLPRLPGRGGLRRIRHIRRIAALPALLTAMAVLLAALLWVGSA